MLVLKRTRDSKTTITTPSGETIVVTIVDIRGNVVRIGFEADRSVAIEWDDCVKGPRPVERAAGETT